MEDLAVNVPGWETAKKEAKKWVNKFIQMKRDLYKSRDDLKRMRNALARYPKNAKLQSHRKEIEALDAAQKKQEGRFFGLEGKLLSYAESLGIHIGLSGREGLDDLALVPVVVGAGVLASAAALYWAVSSHLKAVAEKKRIVDAVLKGELSAEEGSRLIGAGSGGLSSFKWLGLGLVALVALPYLQPRR